MQVCNNRIFYAPGRSILWHRRLRRTLVLSNRREQGKVGGGMCGCVGVQGVWMGGCAGVRIEVLNDAGKKLKSPAKYLLNRAVCIAACVYWNFFSELCIWFFCYHGKNGANANMFIVGI
jgi:hypothetical protein